MKKKLLWISILAMLALCACNTTGKNEPIPTPTMEPVVTITPTTAPTNTPRPTEAPTEEQMAEEKAEAYLAGLNTIDWTELDYYVDEETSRRCSNLINQGDLTYDGEGNIYFIDENNQNSGIYVSDYNGENKRLLCEGSGGWLQIEGDWLYYNSREDGIYRINITTGVREQLYGSTCGEFISDGERLTINSPEEIFATDMEGNSKETLFEKTEISVSGLRQSSDFWLSNAYLHYTIDTDYSMYKKGYLIASDGEKMELLNQRGTDLLLAGSYLSVQDPETYQRHIWNLETGEEVTLDIRYTGKVVVSDGNAFYCSKIVYGDAWYDTSAVICRWDETNGLEELWRIEDASSVDYMYLTPKVLYCVPQVKVNGKFGYHLMYYNLETGETGQIY